MIPLYLFTGPCLIGICCLSVDSTISLYEHSELGIRESIDRKPPWYPRDCVVNKVIILQYSDTPKLQLVETPEPELNWHHTSVSLPTSIHTCYPSCVLILPLDHISCQNVHHLDAAQILKFPIRSRHGTGAGAEALSIRWPFRVGVGL